MSSTTALTDRRLFRLSGPDSVDFLHNLITCDVLNLRTGNVTFGALLTPQGKVLFDFHILREADGFLFDVSDTARDDLMKRLTFYKLRADVKLQPENERQVFAVWGDGIETGDGRRVEMGERFYTAAKESNASLEDWNSHRLSVGVPLSGVDFELGSVFAHDVLMDQFTGGGVDFTKGCYVGQEVVSRMKHRDSARNRFVKVSAETPLPEMGSAIQVGDRKVGTMGSSQGLIGLALVRIDKVGKAMQAGEAMTANGAAVTLTLPDFATFHWGG